MSQIPAFTQFIAINPPNQARSQEALDRILAAGEALLADNAFEEAGISLIAARANSSVGTFYRLLENKDNLSLLLLQRFFSQVTVAVDELCAVERWADKDLNLFAHTFIQSFVNIYAGRRGVLRALILRASRSREFRDRVHQLNDYTADKIVQVLSRHRDQIHHPDPTMAMPTAVHIVLGALNQHTVAGTLGALSPTQLIGELTRVFTAYLTIGEP